MKEMTISTLLEVCSSHAFVSLLNATLPEYQTAFSSIEAALADKEMSTRRKINLIKRVCGNEQYFFFVKQTHDLREILALDLNAPILYNILAEMEIEPPEGCSFEDLAIWTRIHYPNVWELLKARSFRRASSRKVRDYKVTIDEAIAPRYTDAEAIATFEMETSEICSKLGIGKHVKYVFDNVEGGIYRAILFLSPIPLYVMTCNHEAAIFKMKLDENAIKVVLVYNETTKILSIIGEIADVKARFKIAKVWSRIFVGGQCDCKTATRLHALDKFLTLPTTLTTDHPIIKALYLYEISMVEEKIRRITIRTTAGHHVLSRAAIQQTLNHAEAEICVRNVKLTVCLRRPLHRIEKFNISLSTDTITFGGAGDFEDIRGAIKEVLEDFDVYSKRL